MSVFQQVVKLWKDDDLLAQAWNESFDMMVLSNTMFTSAVKYLRRGESLEAIKALKKKDKYINQYQQSVRKKVVTHFSVSKNINNLPNGLVLLSIVIDIERLGDYTKNILDLALHYPDPMISEDFLEELRSVEKEVLSLFSDTLKAVEDQDEELARSLLKRYKKSLAAVSDKIVNDCISGQSSFGDEKKNAAVTLYARYLKRVGGHLKNITTTMLNPYEYIGYNSPK